MQQGPTIRIGFVAEIADYEMRQLLIEQSLDGVGAGPAAEAHVADGGNLIGAKRRERHGPQRQRWGPDQCARSPCDGALDGATGDEGDDTDQHV